MMLTRELFYAKTFVAQCKGYKRFRIEDMFYSALDTLNHAYRDNVISRDERDEAYGHFHNFIYE